MKKWLRRIRGAVGMGLTWAAAWLGVGSILNAVTAVVFGGSQGIEGMVLYAIAGFVVGTAFSGVLGLAEGRRNFHQMSLGRFAAWGALGGLPLGLYMSWLNGDFAPGGSIAAALLLTAVPTLLGAGSAAGSLALARRADDREMLEAGAEVADIGLTEEEKRELLAG